MRYLLIVVLLVLAGCTTSGVGTHDVDCLETETGGYDCTAAFEPYQTPEPAATYTPYPTYTPAPTATPDYFPRTEIVTLGPDFDIFIGPDSVITWTQPNNFRSDVLDWEGRDMVARFWESGIYTFTATWIHDAMWYEVNVVVESPVVPQSIEPVGTAIVTIYTPTPEPWG